MNVAYEEFDEYGISFFITNIQKRDARFTMQIELFGNSNINMLQGTLNKNTLRTLGQALIKAANDE